MLIREKNFQVGDTFGDENHSYTVIGFLPHYMRVECNKCGATQSFHLDDDLEENILSWKKICCPEKNRYYYGMQFKNPMKFFLQKLITGEVLFERFKVVKSSTNAICVTCLKCGHTLYITTENNDLYNYVYDGELPVAGSKLLPNDLCCRKSKKISRNEKRAASHQRQLAKIEEAAKNGVHIDSKNGRKFYDYCGGVLDIHELSELHGIPEQTIRTNIADGMTAEDAVKINGVMGEEILIMAENHDLDPKDLRKLVRSGLSLDDAVEQLEIEAIERLADLLERKPKTMPKKYPF